MGSKAHTSRIIDMFHESIGINPTEDSWTEACASYDKALVQWEKAQAAFAQAVLARKVTLGINSNIELR